jgi:hypothetical protein
LFDAVGRAWARSWCAIWAGIGLAWFTVEWAEGFWVAGLAWLDGASAAFAVEDAATAGWVEGADGVRSVGARAAGVADDVAGLFTDALWV